MSGVVPPLPPQAGAEGWRWSAKHCAGTPSLWSHIWVPGAGSQPSPHSRLLEEGLPTLVCPDLSTSHRNQPSPFPRCLLHQLVSGGRCLLSIPCAKVSWVAIYLREELRNDDAGSSAACGTPPFLLQTVRPQGRHFASQSLSFHIHAGIESASCS